jgi:hypothetical protein
MKVGPIALSPHPPLPFSIKLKMTRPVSVWDNRRGPLVRFRPFDLAPGKTAMLVLAATYPKTCRPYHPGEIADLQPRGFLFRDGLLPIRFHYLWKTSTALIWPQFLLRVRFPKGCR